MKKIYLFVSVICIIALMISAAYAPPEKLPVMAENLSAAQKLYATEILEGFDDGELHGERTLTRAQFAKILTKAFADTQQTDKVYEFSDLSDEHWAHKYIQLSADNGWIEGFDDGTFRPDDEITYEQALTVMCRVLGLIWHNADYPADYVSSAIENSICDKVNALIGEDITREMASQIILNSLEYNERNIIQSNLYTKNSYAPMFSAGGGTSSGKASLKADAESSYNASVYESAMADAALPFMPYVEMNTEEYSSNHENIFKNTITSPLSTFSIDTDTASYSNLRRFILNGQTIPKGSIRSEELINYFDYELAQPENGKKFGVDYTVAKCPWNSSHILARLTVSGEELTEPKPSNLVFLIDTSGSMYSSNKLPLVKQSLSLLLSKLNPEDTVSIVTYASETGVALSPTPANEKDKILAVLDSLNAGGSTAGESGINLAYEQAEKNRIDGNNRVILCTDGDFNVGSSSESELEELISQKRKSGIYLSVLGFGMGNYKDNKMETLADKGNGNYAYIDNLREAKKALVDEMSKTIYTIAKDVKIQVEFNPGKVAQYRLIGYENRLLNNEDFENDAKDAGELGAGATVTVLYEIIPQNGDVRSDLKYQTTSATGSDELMNIKIRYKLPDGDESILNEYPVSSEIDEYPDSDFTFACAVAELGMILNESEYAGTSDYNSVINLARESIGNDPYGIRNEFVQLVDLLRIRNR